MQKIRLNNKRLSFVEVFKASSFQGEGDAQYSVTILIPKDDKQIPAINKAIEAVAQDKWGAKAPAILKAMKADNKICLKDGDAKPDYDGFEGNYYIRASRGEDKGRPTIIDKDKTPLTEADGKPYSGCYGNVMIEFWAQDNKFGKRVNATLTGLQFAADGERFGSGGVASEDDFDDLSDVGEGAEFL